VRRRAVTTLREITIALVARVERADLTAEIENPEVLASLKLLDREALLMYARLHHRGTEEPLGPEDRAAFLRDLTPVIEGMSGCPLLAVSHHLIELLRELVDRDPPTVLRLLHGIVTRGSARNGHAGQHLGMQETVALAERYLTDYPDAMRSGEGRRFMIEILDAFVGWPAAQRLVFRLDELYR
jgi:hypothetical protein